MAATSWVALLRGINLGKAKRVAMADLRAVLADLGYRDVRTLLQSGNVVFTADGGKAADHERRISAGVRDRTGVESRTFVRTADDLLRVVARNPFVARGVDPGELHVTFLAGEPDPAVLSSLDLDELAPDEFEVGAQVLYERRPGGVQGSRLPDWERLLGVPATARSWKTVTRLADLAASTASPGDRERPTQPAPR